MVCPTVPETPGHHHQPRVYRGSDADHIMPSVVRRKAIGSFRADTGQAVRMRLRTASIIGVANRIDWPIALSYTRPSRRRIVGRCQFMFVDCQLLYGERRLPDSAGNTQS